MNDDNFLTQQRKSPRREFATELYQRINKPMSKQSAFNFFQGRRPALAFSALALLLVATLLFSPAVRTFAGDQLRQISAFLFRPASGTVSVGPQPTVPAPVASTIQQADSPDQASELAGFTVLAPAYLPDSYSLQGSWSVYHQENVIYVVAAYAAENGRHFLIMNQTRFEEEALFEQGYADNETVSDVMIGGHNGVFISGRLMAYPDRPATTNDEQPDLVPTNWLIWEVNGITYSLFGDSLEQSELIRIAESLNS